MANAEEYLICLNCGYDLRGIASTRCPECGKEFDPENYRPSLIPWEHDFSGRFKYFRTVLKMLFGEELADEMHREHDLKKAKRFRRKTCWEMGFVLLLACYTPLVLTGTNLGRMLMRFSDDFLPSFYQDPGFLDNFLHEVFMVMGLGFQGAWGWILPPILLVVMTREWVFVMSDAMKQKPVSPTAQALGCYLAAFPGFLMNWTVVVAGFELICALTGILSPVVFSPFRSGGMKITGFVWVGVGLWALGALATLILAANRSRQWINGVYEEKKVSLLGQWIWLGWTYCWRTFFWLIFIPCFVGLSRMVLQGLFRW